MNTYSLIAIQLRQERRRARLRGRMFHQEQPTAGVFRMGSLDTGDERLVEHVSGVVFHPFMPLKPAERLIDGERRVWDERLGCWVLV